MLPASVGNLKAAASYIACRFFWVSCKAARRARRPCIHSLDDTARHATDIPAQHRMTPLDHPLHRTDRYSGSDDDHRTGGHLIVGMTHAGKPFRPGDWPERLAGVIALFVKERRPGSSVASTWLAVPLVGGGARCLHVSGELAQICPEAFEFVMRFAEDNELQVRADECDWQGQAASMTSLSNAP
jgi:hypothetical protein